ncbi:MAG: hypothetical protein A4E73_00761 [Syntrophaceae bacterium PtaU1.Bin231]|nr:MAG: hypothetical protein A4E73_00761 [Syntrophaceae bacterium PtaU1.Bin231]HOG17034.1 PA2779 family protein [Syntrophales bacterium]
MLNKFRIPTLAMSVVAYLVLFMTFPAGAGLIPSIPSSIETADGIRKAEIDKVQKVLEMQIVADKLQAYGLSAEEVKAKLQGMSDGQLHVMAQASDRVLAGGDGLGFVIALLLVVLLAVLILKLMGKEIIVRTVE